VAAVAAALLFAERGCFSPELQACAWCMHVHGVCAWHTLWHLPRASAKRMPEAPPPHPSCRPSPADLHLQTFTCRPSPADLYLQTFTRGGTAAFKRAAVVLLEDAWPEDELETGTRTPAAVAALTGLALAMAR